MSTGENRASLSLLAVWSSREDAGAFAVIAQKQALAHYVLHSFVSAAGYYQDAWVAAQAYRIGDSAAELEISFRKQAFLLELLWGLTTQHFLTANYEASQAYVEDARRLGGTIGRPLHRMATVEWTAALLHRWQQVPLEAFNVIQKARSMYNVYSFGTPVENARLEIAAADIALDVVASLGSGSFTSTALAISKECIGNALSVTEAYQDMAGQGMALLALVRLNRFQSQPIDRTAILQHVLAQARQMGDRELQCQAFTALGDELLGRDQQDPGLNAYRQALKIVASSDGTAMGKRALQRLLDAMNGKATA
jgi:hypothetical protein